MPFFNCCEAWAGTCLHCIPSQPGQQELSFWRCIQKTHMHSHPICIVHLCCCHIPPPIWVWSHGFLFHGPWSSHCCAYYDQKLTNLGCYSQSTYSCYFSGANFPNFLIEYKYECICLHFLHSRPQLVQVTSLTVFFFGFESSFSFFNTELKSKCFCVKLLALRSLWFSFWAQEPLELQLIWLWLIL